MNSDDLIQNGDLEAAGNEVPEFAGYADPELIHDAVPEGLEMSAVSDTAEEPTKAEIRKRARMRKTEIHRDVNGQILGFLAYYGVFSLIISAALLLLYLPRIITAAIQMGSSFITSNEFFQLLTEMTMDGLPYLIAIPFCIAVFWLIVRKKVTVKEIFARNEKMTVKSLLKITAVLMAVQFPTTVLDLGLQGIAGLFGKSGGLFNELMGGLTSTTNVPMILYVSFFGPITEEIIFRGLLQTPLRKYGRFSAVLISALLFGAMHMNLTQTIFACAVGLVLGYVRDKYSIGWAMFLHILNNGIFGTLLSFLLGLVNNNAFLDAFNWIWQALFFAAGVAVIVLDRAKIKEMFAEFKAEKDGKVARKSPLYLAILILFMVAAVFVGLEMYFV